MNRKKEMKTALENNQNVILIGLDVHKNSYQACAQDFLSGEIIEKRINSSTKAVTNFIELIKENCDNDFYILVGYEAGPTGNQLKKDLDQKGINCDIIPLKYIQRSDKSIKTDRRDARDIVNALKLQEYQAVYVGKDTDEDVKYFIRMRDDLMKPLKAFKQQISSFILNHGYKYKPKNKKRATKWTIEHLKWLNNLELPSLQREILDSYLKNYQNLELQIKELDKRIKQIAMSEEYAYRVSRLRCFKGIDYLIALAIIVEIGDFERFENPGKLANYLGLIPGEHSSGDDKNQGRITKKGNKFLRRLLILAAQGAARGKGGLKSNTQLQKEAGNSPEMLLYAQKGNDRIHNKFYHLFWDLHKPRNVAITALARELVCFVWGAMTDHIG